MSSKGKSTVWSCNSISNVLWKAAWKVAVSEKNSWHSMILIRDVVYFITAWQIPLLWLIYEFCMILQPSIIMVQLMEVIFFYKWPLEKWNTVFLTWFIWSSILTWRGYAEWNSSFYVTQISFLCLNLKQCDQFAVTALRAFIVKICRSTKKHYSC